MTPADLKALIQSDPTALAHYQSGQHSACATRCAEIAPPVRQPVAAADVLYQAAVSGVWAKINLARESAQTPDQVKGVCLTFIDWVRAGRPLDLDMPEVVAMMAGLQAAGVVTEPECEALDALANVPQTFTTDDIQQAMRS